ncbi:30S ribosome-binding factor RbfA [Kineococcus sp. SYSU DK005]|uniref:30S ribosome-binding factor RbfA n=1 Tax=Kineococcus sp. SYSU DK005 TaxID=3383126 RepID=UPI003D7E7BF0
MADPTRARKLADRIKVVVAEALEKRVKDPRLGFVTITDARVTNDLQHATLYYTVLGSDEERAGTAIALKSATGVLRSEVGRRTGVRLTPTLTFTADEVPQTATQIEDLLRAAAEQDARVAALAASAQPAGEADPYKKPVEHDLDEDDDEFEDDEDEEDDGEFVVDEDDDLDDLDDDVPARDDLDGDGTARQDRPVA